MAHVTKQIKIPTAVSAVYGQWTQFESFPSFMEGVEEVRQLDAKRLHWKAAVAGKSVEWDAEITEQIPDTRIAWKNTNGATNAGVVDFHRLNENECEITLSMDVEPHGLTETVGAKLGFLDRQVEGDLERFRDLMAEKGASTAGWRGEIKQPNQ